MQLYQTLPRSCGLCLPRPFDAKTAGAGLLRLLARAADVPDFASLDATLVEHEQRSAPASSGVVGTTPGHFYAASAFRN